MDKLILFIFLLHGVWCEDWPISLPEKIEALNGFCVTINCRFDINNTFDKDLTDRAAGVWYKDGTDYQKNVVFNSNRTNLYFKGEIIGKLKSKDCTTIFYNVTSNYSGQFYFRIEGNDGLQYTYKQKSVSINVIASPSKPTVQMFKDQMEVEVHEEVLEGSSMCLRCSAKTLCSSSPPTLTWSSTDRLHLNENSRLQLDQQNQTEIISDLNFTATHLQHGVTFICTITYQLKQRNTTAQNNITLRVQYAPKNTSVSVFPSNSVLEGSSVTLICSSDGNPAVFNYTWYRENGGQLKELQTGYNLTFNVTDPKHTGLYYCQAKNQHGTVNTSVLLDIQYAPKNTSVSVFPSNSVLEDSSVTLICSSDGNPAVFNYTWYRENEGQLEELQTGSNLTFNVTDRTHTGRYYCQTKNIHGTQNTSVLLDIQYAPKISLFSCNRTDVTVCLCEAHGNPSPKVEWFLSGRPVSNSTNTFISEERLSSTNLRSFISLHQSLTHTNTLQCATTNTHGNASEKIQLFCCPQETTGFSLFYVLIGAAIGVSIIIILCVIKHLCKRRENSRSSKTRQEDINGLNLTDKKIEEHVYSNKAVLSHAEDASLNYPESLHYSSINFINTQTESEEVKGVSSLTTVYADVQHYSGQEEEKSSVGSVEPLPNSNIATVVKQENHNSTDTEQDQSKEAYPALKSGEVSDLYAQVKHCHTKN